MPNHNGVVFAQRDDVATGDATEAEIAARSPDFAMADNKKMGRVAGCDKTVRIQHQRFVGTGLGRLNAGGDAVQLGVAVELRVLYIGITTAHVYGE